MQYSRHAVFLQHSCSHWLSVSHSLLGSASLQPATSNRLHNTAAVTCFQSVNALGVLQFSSQLHVAQYPYVALLSGSSSGTKKVASSEGLATPADLMQLLQPAVEEHGAQFVADQADHSERVGGTLSDGAAPSFDTFSCLLKLPVCNLLRLTAVHFNQSCACAPLLRVNQQCKNTSVVPVPHCASTC